MVVALPTGESLLLCSVGPVQDFIAAARRCQDLWFGSWMLSDLARAAADAMARMAGAEALVFPAAIGNDKPSVANKILLRLSDGLDPLAVATAGKEGLRQRLSMLQKALPDAQDRYLHTETALRQISDLMEYHWVAVPLAVGYDAARDRAEALLAGRKNARDWQAVPWDHGAGVPKCSVCGQRESVLDESLYETPRAEERARRYRLRGGERLCGVCLLKRIGAEIGFDDPHHQSRPPFHSTSHVAAAPLLVRMARRGAISSTAFNAYCGSLEEAGVDLERYRIRPGQGGSAAQAANPFAEGGLVDPPRVFTPADDGRGLDGYLLFEDRIADVLDESGVTPDPVLLDRLRAALRAVMADLDVPCPPAYYALLQADGDAMGRAIAQLARLHDGVAAHRELSRQLESFAGGAVALIERHGGSAIYAGGDDVLALLPLHTALACADALRTTFAARIQPLCDRPDVDVRPTLSVGIAVCHHMDDLADARHLARRAEGLAKSTRNALGIIVSKRGGADLECRGAWSEGPRNLAQRIDFYCTQYRAGNLPQGVAYDLEEAVKVFDRNLAPESPVNLPEMVKALARRVLGRKRGGGGSRSVAQDVVDAISERMDDPADALRALLSVSRELQVARTFFDAYDVAWVDRAPAATEAAQP